MAITLSHQTALDVTRMLRSQNTNIQKLDNAPLVAPTPWKGKYWVRREFIDSVWNWPVPTRGHPLHALIPPHAPRIRSELITTHTTCQDLSQNAIVWLDERTSMVGPELLFLQMASVLPLPLLVMLGYELCGNFTRDANDPAHGHVCQNVPAATSVANIARLLDSVSKAKSLAIARTALSYVCDNALSVPEAALAAIYTFPPSESGYDMGPVTLNRRIDVESPGNWTEHSARFPDLMFSFAPVGINYDGEADHLDLKGLARKAHQAVLANAEDRVAVAKDLAHKLKEVRSKAVDDNMRNRQLLAKGKIILPVTKEDLYSAARLDYLTRQILECAHNYFGTDIDKYISVLDNTELRRDRNELLSTLLGNGNPGDSSYGKM